MQATPDEFLQELAEKLRVIERRKLATQVQIEAETGIDQTTISRARSLSRRRVTPQLRALMEYADMLLEPQPLPLEVSRAANAFFRVGGNEAELVASIEHAARLVSRKRGWRA